jgi:hypothetical protein
MTIDIAPTGDAALLPRLPPDQILAQVALQLVPADAQIGPDFLREFQANWPDGCVGHVFVQLHKDGTPAEDTAARILRIYELARARLELQTMQAPARFALH